MYWGSGGDGVGGGDGGGGVGDGDGGDSGGGRRVVTDESELPLGPPKGGSTILEKLELK